MFVVLMSMPAAGERQEEDALALQRLGELQLHHHLAAAAGERLVQLGDALGLGTPSASIAAAMRCCCA